MELIWWQYLAIALLGTLAGIINIMAGGGSNLILPVLMMFGIPPDIANGSNRVGIFLQTITGIRGFAKAGKIPPHRQWQAVLVPTLLGGIAGAVAASVLPNWILKPTLLLSMLTVATIVLVKPRLFEVQAASIPQPLRPHSWILLFFIGIYGGFVQAGVGLLMLPVFAGLLGYDMIRSNALKLLCTMGFTTAAFLIFIVQGQIWWGVGIALAAGNTLGAMIGVRLALKLPVRIVRWLIFVMTLVAVMLAFFK